MRFKNDIMMHCLLQMLQMMHKLLASMSPPSSL